MEMNVYWPFTIPAPGAQSAEAASQIHFMEAAFAEGFRPYKIPGGAFGASNQVGRAAEVIHRGRGRYWEALLVEGGSVVEDFYLDGLDHAAEAVLIWLRGASSSDVASQFERQIVPKPGDHGWRLITSSLSTTPLRSSSLWAIRLYGVLQMTT